MIHKIRMPLTVISDKKLAELLFDRLKITPEARKTFWALADREEGPHPYWLIFVPYRSIRGQLRLEPMNIYTYKFEVDPDETSVSMFFRNHEFPSFVCHAIRFDRSEGFPCKRLKFSKFECLINYV